VRDDGGLAVTADDGESEILLATKLFPPRRRAASVTRPRLLQVLRRAGEVPLSLVVAPAGWGKTTVVMDWLEHDRISAAWVSLDVSENDPKRFWSYLIAAVRQVAPEVGGEAERRLGAAGSEVVRDVLPRLVNDLAKRREDLVVVLDDLHAIGSPEVYEALGLLLTRAPPSLHLVVTTRTDPPLPVSRLRLHGDLVELRAEQLRFTGEESGRLLNELMGLALAEDDVRRLLDRTEGWAAGLQLAGLSLSGQVDRPGFIARFSGMDRHLVDYLGEEVLNAQPAEVRDFLLRTSVLNRLSGPLCSAVLEGADGARLIDEVYRANLFLVPLDSDRRWFRYHYLFRELLRSELVRTMPDQTAVLHRRAASWYAVAGEIVEAVHHAVEARDPELAAELVRGGWRMEFNVGRWPTVQRWLAALPAETVAADAGLVAAGVWIAVDRGLLDEAATLLDAAEPRHRDDPHLRVLHALYRYKTGDILGAGELLAEPGGRQNDPFLGTVQDLLRGATAFWSGDNDAADRWLTAACVRAGADGNRLASIYALGLRALVHLARGDVTEADAALADADRLVAATLSDAHFVAMFPALARAQRVELTGQFDAAAEAAGRALTLARRGAGRVELAAALVTAARTRRYGTRQDGPPGGAELLAEARRLLLSCPAPGPVAAAWLAAEDRAARPVRSGSAAEPWDGSLTERELAILRLLAGPASQRQLAEALFVSANTLKTHLRAIYRKLDVGSRAEAVVRARDLGLL
jgi:ATP/maltotriose-dependent transcriptional regulator MalT